MESPISGVSGVQNESDTKAFLHGTHRSSATMVRSFFKRSPDRNLSLLAPRPRIDCDRPIRRRYRPQHTTNEKWKHGPVQHATDAAGFNRVSVAELQTLMIIGQHTSHLIRVSQPCRPARPENIRVMNRGTDSVSHSSSASRTFLAPSRTL